MVLQAMMNFSPQEDIDRIHDMITYLEMSQIEEYNQKYWETKMERKKKVFRKKMVNLYSPNFMAASFNISRIGKS